MYGKVSLHDYLIFIMRNLVDNVLRVVRVQDGFGEL